MLAEASLSAVSALFLAKAPTPMTHSGFRMLMMDRRWMSHAASNWREIDAGSLSGVKFRPDSSRKASGQ